MVAAHWSLGWTLLVLILGLAAGSLLNLALSPTAVEQLALSPLQIQALPAALLLWAAALFWPEHQAAVGRPSISSCSSAAVTS